MTSRTEAHAAGYQQARQDDECGDILAMVNYPHYEGHGLSPELTAFWIMGYEHYMRLKSAGEVFKIDPDQLPD